MSQEYPNNAQFFQNRSCSYFPCHDCDESIFNCLFCYCPLYFLGEKCGGKFKRIGVEGEVKDCSQCTIPHEKDNYSHIINMISKNIEQFK